MAKKVTTSLLDDYEAASGKEVEADQTVIFMIDGAEYEIDLSAKNATKLRNEVEQWARHARRTSGRKSNARRLTATAKLNGSSDGMDTEQRKAAREWLRNNTTEWKDLGDRGRLPAEALAAFHAKASVA